MLVNNQVSDFFLSRGSMGNQYDGIFCQKYGSQHSFYQLYSSYVISCDMIGTASNMCNTILKILNSSRKSNSSRKWTFFIYKRKPSFQNSSYDLIKSQIIYWDMTEADLIDVE